ncbi:MAG: DUF1559 domain-containing protein [Planctomycetota bacterium]
MDTSANLRSHRRHVLRNPLRAFTLVELLVVVSIIAVVIGIVLPVLGSARETTRRVACLSQQKQIGVGFHAFAAENKGELPYGYERIGYGLKYAQRALSWDDALHPYLNGTATRDEQRAGLLDARKALDVLICPADPTADQARTHAGVTGAARSYGVVGNASMAFDANHVFDWRNANALAGRDRRSLEDAGMTDHGGTIMLTEATMQNASLTGGFAFTDYHNTQGAAMWSILTSPVAQATDSAVGSFYADHHALAHSNDRDRPAFNYLFLDGHAESLAFRDTGVDDTWLAGWSTAWTYAPEGMWSVRDGD